MEKYKINIYTDGACSGNPGKGGYGVIMEVDGTNLRKEFSKGYRLTTNNRMELLAVIKGLGQLKKQGCRVVVYSDSRYVVDAVEKGWVFQWEEKNFKDRKNADLWIEFLKQYRKHSVSFVWVKGHNNHPMNERCDFLAVKASGENKLLIDQGFEQE